MEAYMLETLRNNGVSNQEVLTQIDKKDVNLWDTLDANFDFSELIKLAEKDHNEFKSIVLNGYQVKFVTFKGLQRLLELKFNKKEGNDYQLDDRGITGLQLDESQLVILKQMLSKNWNVQEEQSKSNVYFNKEISVGLI